MTGIEFVERNFDTAGDAAIRRNATEGNLNQLAGITFDEGCGFEYGGEQFGVNTFIVMVDTGVRPGEAKEFIGFAGEQAGPDFGTNPGAVAVVPLFVVAEAGKRRQKAVDHIEFANPVFIPRSGMNRSQYSPSNCSLTA